MDINLDELNNKKKVKVSVDGWKLPLMVEYGVGYISNQSYLLWRVDGTHHVFNIPLLIVMKHHGGKYIDHFKVTLEKFREDLLLWVQDGLPEVWMEEYHKQFYDLLAV